MDGAREIIEKESEIERGREGERENRDDSDLFVHII